MKRGVSLTKTWENNSGGEDSLRGWWHAAEAEMCVRQMDE